MWRIEIMSNLTSKLSLFFESECNTLAEVDTLLQEHTLQQEWLDAVALYRKGTILLQKNDFSGLEVMQAANEALKKVVANGKKEKTESAFKALSEAIVKTTKETIVESVANIKLAFTPFYVAMKESKYKELLNESNFYDEGTEVIKEDEDCDDEETEEPKLEEDVPNAPAPVASPTDMKEPVSQTPAPTEQKLDSAYKTGFTEGQSYWKMGEGHKNFLKTVVEQNLSEKPYSWVKRYEEGFSSGYAYAEEVQRDTNPEAFKALEAQKVEGAK